VHRVDRGDGNTACSQACPSGAITFGDLNDPNSEIAKKLAAHGGLELRARLGLDTGVRYQGVPG